MMNNAKSGSVMLIPVPYVCSWAVRGSFAYIAGHDRPYLSYLENCLV